LYSSRKRKRKRKRKEKEKKEPFKPNFFKLVDLGFLAVEPLSENPFVGCEVPGVRKEPEGRKRGPRGVLGTSISRSLREDSWAKEEWFSIFEWDERTPKGSFS